ncbi:hypothetical protein SAMN04488030_1607 [Aliiroseovarius halocynthiae]|nr:hypothetical protein SAMN04488030_1607 [Aliiroseovarius halocynthiae]
MKIFALGVAVAATSVVAGCVDRSAYESNPVKIKSPKGEVTCQLYTRDRVQWDESIAVPPGMSKAEGDALCIQEGHRQFRSTHNRVRPAS